VDEGEIVTIIGANGAGKTTLLRCISGLYRPQKGSIQFDGKEITRLGADQIVSAGISQVPEGRLVFAPQSVNTNLMLGAYHRRKSHKSEIAKDLDFVFRLFPILKERQDQPAGTLSGGEQQMLAIGRALMARPRLLLLDEPSMGLAPVLVNEIFRVIKSLADEGVTMLLVEQNARKALNVAHRGYVLETGSVALAGDAGYLLTTDEVRRIYLGDR